MRSTVRGSRRTRLRTTFGVAAAVAGLIAATASAAVAAGSLGVDLDAGVGDAQTKAITVAGELTGGTAQTQPIDLWVNGGGNTTATYTVTGASTTDSDVTATMAAVSVTNSGAHQSGTIAWTAPTALTGDATYTLKMAFTATNGLNTNGSDVAITFTVSGTGTGGGGPVDTDGDGVADGTDNCPAVANANQANADGDSLGDACDPNAFKPQVAVAAVDPNAGEGTQQSAGGTFSDADPNSSLTISKTSGDGTVTDNGDGTWSWSYTPTDEGTGTVRVGVSDGEHADIYDEFTWTATNVAPTVSGLTIGSGTGTACLAGNAVTLDFGFTDPGTEDDPWTVVVDWGDDKADDTYTTATQGTQPRRSHTYGVGSYTIGVTVTDEDGGADTEISAAGAVQHTWDMTGILAPFNADGSSIWKFGSTIPVKVKVTDCHGASVEGLELRVGTKKESASAPTDGIVETPSTSSADTTGVMRYDGTAGQYIYNFASKYLPDGSATYFMYVTNTDVTGHAADGTLSAGQSVQKFGLKTK